MDKKDKKYQPTQVDANNDGDEDCRDHEYHHNHCQTMKQYRWNNRPAGEHVTYNTDTIEHNVYHEKRDQLGEGRQNYYLLGPNEDSVRSAYGLTHCG